MRNLGIKHDRNVAKMRVLTFLQSAENQKEVTFDTIEKEMQIPTDEIESFIIEGKNINLCHNVTLYK